MDKLIILLIALALFFYFLPKILAFIASLFTSIIFPILGAVAIIIAIVLIIKAVKGGVKRANARSFKPNKVFVVPKITLKDATFANRESQIISEEFNIFCDYYNIRHPYDAHIDFLNEKLSRTKKESAISEITAELSQLTKDRDADLSKAGIEYQYYVPTVFSDSELERFYSVRNYVLDLGIEKPANSNIAYGYYSALSEFFHESSSVIICGVLGCVILLPEYVVTKEYGSAPFRCIEYSSNMFKVSYTDHVLYSSYQHSNRNKGDIETVWQHANKDGSQDLRHKYNNSTDYINLADLFFRCECGFETITRNIPFNSYSDGSLFEQVWADFIEENKRFNKMNDTLLNSEPEECDYSNSLITDNCDIPNHTDHQEEKTDEASTPVQDHLLIDGNDGVKDGSNSSYKSPNNAVDVPLAVPVSSPYYRKKRVQPTTEKKDIDK